MKINRYVQILTIILLVNTVISLEQIKWKIGNYWEYNLYYYIPQTGTEKIKITVIGKENISINNTIYECLVVEIKQNNLTRKIQYYEKRSLAVVKEIEYNNIAREKIFVIPVSFFSFPIYIGKKWNLTRNNISIFLECIGKEKVTTKAGKFNCHIIKIIFNNNTKFYQMVYFSDKVGNIVMMKCFFNNTLLFREELITFNYNSPTKNTIITTFILTLGIMIFLLLNYVRLIIKRNQKR